jgi:UDP:flavonoid glycosyltransferase YjiC (YdhE family)
MGHVLTSGHTVRLLTVVGAVEGRGHLSRSLAMGAGLSARGIQVELVLARGELSPHERAQAEEARVALPATAMNDPAAVVVDAPDLLALVEGIDPRRLVVVDDGDAFNGSAAIVIQPSKDRWAGGGEADRVLAGYAFVPLRANFRELREATHSGVPADPPRVVACFGGSDPAGVSRRLAMALAGSGRWAAEIVLGPGYLADGSDWPVVIRRDPDDLPALLGAADLAVLAAGTLKFEAACLGTPALLLAVSDDQLSVGPAFAATGAAVYLGDGRTIDPVEVEATIAELVQDQDRRVAIGRRARVVVDGRGAERIADAIAGLIDSEESGR